MPLEEVSVSRRSERLPVRLPICLMAGPASLHSSYPASVCDWSCHGTRIRTRAPISPGEFVVIEASGELPCRVRGRIVWVGPEGSAHEGHAGVEFVPPLPMPA